MRFIFLLILLSCGTETGNPVRSVAQNGPSAEIGSANYSASFRIISELCHKLNSCDSNLSRETCLDQIYPLSSIAPRLGIPDSTYNDFEAVIDAELNDEITNNPDNVIDCINTFMDYECDGVEITGSYNSNAPTNFTQIHLLLANDLSTCGGVF